VKLAIDHSIIVEIRGEPGLGAGDAVRVKYDAAHVHVFREIGLRVG
jgi:hypothetical protein